MPRKRKGKRRRRGKPEHPGKQLQSGPATMKFPGMKTKMKMSEMSAPLSRRFCEQLLCRNQGDGMAVLPPELPAYNEGRPKEIGPGILEVDECTIDVTASTGGYAALVLVCGRSGFADAVDVLYSNLDTWAGTSLPTAAAIGLTTTTSTPLSLVSSNTTSFARMPIPLGKRLQIISNSASSMTRKGKYYLGWLPDTNTTTIASLGNSAYMRGYDAAMLNDNSKGICYMPPRAICVNNSVTADATVYTGMAVGGYLVFAASGMNDGDVVSIKITSLHYYTGSFIPKSVTVHFSTLARDCAMSCWANAFGNAPSVSQGGHGQVVNKVMTEAGKHTLGTQPAPAASSWWDTIVDVGKTAWKYLAPLL